MSLNRIKAMKSMIGRAELKKKIVTLQCKLRKVKAEKLVAIEVCQENTEVFENVEKALKLEIDGEKKEMKKVVKSYNNFLVKIKEHLECPVCLEIPRSGPVFVCPNGHFVCEKCKRGLCPTCRADMGDGKSLLAVAVIENIEHKCKFVECEALFAKDKLDAHEKICKHRTVKCPHSKCEVEIALSKLVEHLGEKTCASRSKPTVIDTSSKTGTANFKIDKISEKENMDRSWKVYTYSYRDINFVICASKAGNFYHFTMVMLETNEVCSKFKIEMEVYERDSSYQDSEHSIRFRGNPCSIDANKEQVKFRGLTVHHEDMKNMANGNEELPFTMSFSFSEKRARDPEGLE